jgi:hypothetical protein
MEPVLQEIARRRPPCRAGGKGDSVPAAPGGRVARIVPAGAVATPGRIGWVGRRGRVVGDGRVVAVSGEISGPGAAESRSGDRLDQDNKQ